MTKYLIILGTTSHSGKSILVTALCRMLKNRGLRVAPFKSQNMSLNSWVTTSGGEIGIAQAVQAWAAGVEPSVLMNPILLKPKGDRTSQVIIMGRPVADKSAADYYKDIDSLKEVVDSAIEELSRDYDYIIVEGAGGAAEINLFDRDIANIYVASRLRAPIILVGDIERGGVFASLYGTVKLLPPEIRELVKGMVINKFRGDPTILQPGIKMLEELTGIPVLGILPYLDLQIPSEDSVSLLDKTGPQKEQKEDLPEIAIIKLPRISNFTDFEPLERYARVRYVDLKDDLGNPDAVIIPGTKNTVSDLAEMRRHGMDRKILSLKNVPIIGICGGYQILGREIIDCGIEDICGSIPGLGLIDAVTRFDAYEKRTVQVTKEVTGDGPILGRIKGEYVKGYEIHMGITESRERSAFGDDGAVAGDGMVIGTYLHGLFENENFRNAFLDYLYDQRGLMRRELSRDTGFDALSEAVERHLDMKSILKMLELDVSASK
ncbi:MAG: cobyric acid synthase [Methanothrix sp.]|uniref:Probable cobyric acid synthase n=1 Tax=Methanothrix thermoacetophila (strain DSM 6194 / JCM 14653 / NBRC 101360 / PT) TaxID=349307 RepID=A0B654_METTP|nr:MULTISPECIES: cobyric acid synthase [Methanothrix]ABK14178.1 adenosylcobyric acid synthase (glutamine-hydrolysing) [Methanothrix thermoacetophila PT]MBC7079723.1 cobyric acid synthase [Methanothrix sp.]NPU87798.1 cobyric acid synthase [Methanothrix sp.]